MTNADLANIVADAIAHRPATGDDKYYICYFNHRIQCLPFNHVSPGHPIIFSLRKIHLEQGFKPAEWDEIVRELLKINFVEAKK